MAMIFYLIFSLLIFKTLSLLSLLPFFPFPLCEPSSFPLLIFSCLSCLLWSPIHYQSQTKQVWYFCSWDKVQQSLTIPELKLYDNLFQTFLSFENHSPLNRLSEALTSCLLSILLVGSRRNRSLNMNGIVHLLQGLKNHTVKFIDYKSLFPCFPASNLLWRKIKTFSSRKNYSSLFQVEKTSSSDCPHWFTKLWFDFGWRLRSCFSFWDPTLVWWSRCHLKNGFPLLKLSIFIFLYSWHQKY